MLVNFYFTLKDAKENRKVLTNLPSQNNFVKKNKCCKLFSNFATTLKPISRKMRHLEISITIKDSHELFCYDFVFYNKGNLTNECKLSS